MLGCSTWASTARSTRSAAVPVVVPAVSASRSIVKSCRKSDACFSISAVGRPSSAARLRTRSRTRGGEDHSLTTRSGDPVLSSSASSNAFPPVSSFRRSTIAWRGATRIRRSRSSMSCSSSGGSCILTTQPDGSSAAAMRARCGDVHPTCPRRLPRTRTRLGVDNVASCEMTCRTAGLAVSTSSTMTTTGAFDERAEIQCAASAQHVLVADEADRRVARNERVETSRIDRDIGRLHTHITDE